jgi:hypothetical protein
MVTSFDPAGSACAMVTIMNSPTIAKKNRINPGNRIAIRMKNNSIITILIVPFALA